MFLLSLGACQSDCAPLEPRRDDRRLESPLSCADWRRRAAMVISRAPGVVSLFRAYTRAGGGTNHCSVSRVPCIPAGGESILWIWRPVCGFGPGLCRRMADSRAPYGLGRHMAVSVSPLMRGLLRFACHFGLPRGAECGVLLGDSVKFSGLSARPRRPKTVSRPRLKILVARVLGPPCCWNVRAAPRSKYGSKPRSTRRPRAEAGYSAAQV